MTRFLLLVAGLIALAWFGAAQLPIGFVLQRLPLNAMGVQWTQSEGTVWDGRVMGVYVNGQPVGDVDVALQPVSLLTLRPELDVQWGGAGGRGAGLLLFETGAVEARELRFEQRVSALESLSADLRAIGGNFRLSDGAVRIEDGRCTSATGAVQSDTLTLAARQFGRTFSDLTGAISCEDGAFQIEMSGDGSTGDTIAITAQATLQGQSEIHVAVSTADRELEALLANAGFSREDGVWTYRRASVASGQGNR